MFLVSGSEISEGNLRSVLGTPLRSDFHGNVYDPSLWAGHLSEVKTVMVGFEYFLGGSHPCAFVRSICFLAVTLYDLLRLDVLGNT